jgi:GT2 family glycosyltransferase
MSDERSAPAEAELPEAEFDEVAYLNAFPRIVTEIQAGRFASAYDHLSRVGARERRLQHVNYHRALAAQKVLRGLVNPAAETAAPAAGLDTVILGAGGIALVIGWVDDRRQKLQTITLHLADNTMRQTRQIARCRRGDAEAAVAAGGPALLGFWAIVALGPDPARVQALSLQVGEDIVRLPVAATPMADEQLRDTAFEYFANAAYLGNPAVEGCLQLDGGAGDALIAFNRTVSARVTGGLYVERHGPRLADPAASIIICLYGRAEFFFMQQAFFSADAGCRDYEFIFICNSPELSDSLQKEARIAAMIYGLSVTLVLLPGNAGFGAANNAAVAQASGRRVIMLNPDVFPRDNAWAAAHAAVVDCLPAAQTAMFGVPLYYDDGSLMHGGMYFDVDRGLSVRADGITHRDLLRVEHYGKGSPPENMQFRRARPVPAVTGAFISADRDWFEKLGGFSADYVFGHYEDADLCLKSYAAGQPVWLHDLAFWHLESKGSVRRRAHEGGTMLNRWHFSRTWLDLVHYELNGQSPSGLIGVQNA